MMRIIAKHADIASPMIPLPEAKAKIAAICSETGRDTKEIRWLGGGSLFLHDNPIIEQQAVKFAVEQYAPAKSSSSSCRVST